jgi:hypothetical protein
VDKQGLHYKIIKKYEEVCKIMKSFKEMVKNVRTKINTIVSDKGIKLPKFGKKIKIDIVEEEKVVETAPKNIIPIKRK